MNERVYLDWNASAPMTDAARAAMAAALALPGNPSSVHAEGRAARRLVEDARQRLASALGAEARQVVFTSGGTEANALALASAGDCQRLIVSAIEHPSVLAGGRFVPEAIERAPVTADGVIDLARLEMLLEGQPPALVSVMAANNETGVIQPIGAVAGLVHAHGGLLHVDAVQAFQKIPFNIKELGADLASVSAHKIGGPKGVGALITGSAQGEPLQPLLRGGGQERGRRAGTENVAAIAGFGAAILESALDMAHQRALQTRLEAGLKAAADVTIFAESVQRLPNTTCFGLEGLSAETALIAFDLAGIAISSGSACSSGKITPSHVLLAMGVAPGLAASAIRVSTGGTTTEADIDRFLDSWQKLLQTLPNKTSPSGKLAAKTA